MSKKVLLIGGASSSATARESLEELYPYLQETLPDCVLHATYLDKLIFSLTADSFELFDSMHNVHITDFDIVYIRGAGIRLQGAYAYYVSKWASFNNVKCVNDYSSYYSGTKVAQTAVFQDLSVPFLDTIYGAEKHVMATQAVRRFGFPFVLKTNIGSHGDSNYLINNQDALDQALREEPNVDFLAQAFCPNDKDYRLLLCGSEALLFARNGSDDTHLNNTSRGATASEVSLSELPDEIIKGARAIANNIGLTISGVDIVPRLGTNEYYFLEINSQPQLRTGALLAEKKALVQRLFAQLG